MPCLLDFFLADVLMIEKLDLSKEKKQAMLLVVFL